VTNLIWIPDRILATGWNNDIIEWEATKEVGDSKSWLKCHTDVILASTLCWPQGVTTSSYNGELIFYKLETGQPYKKFNVGNPTVRYFLSFYYFRPLGILFSNLIIKMGFYFIYVRI
jgi:hypothetical protein